MKSLSVPALAIALLMSSATARSAGPQTQLTFYGQAAFRITTPKGKVLLIDPWLKNPLDPFAKDGKDPLAQITRCDYILITHGHFDHVGDAVAIAKKTGARLVTNFELGTNMARLLGYPKEQMGFDTLMNIGGEIQIADGEVTVDMVPAIHSSGIDAPDAGEKGTPVAYGGNPAGFVLKIQNGPTIYDTGDTAFFRDMELIAEAKPDLALINIGGHFGMEPAMAARAAAAVKAKMVIPQHYKTFPILTQDPAEFFKILDSKMIAHSVMEPGSNITFEGRKFKK